MRYFTPDLYLRHNSPDDRIADAATEAWEESLQAYQAHLEHLRDRLPTRVRELSELYLHDAELLAQQDAVTPDSLAPTGSARVAPFWVPQSILSLRQGDTLVTLIYHLRDNVRTTPAPHDWPFSKGRVDWLYDEIDTSAESFLHRVFLSDGRLLEIPFASVVIHSAPLKAAKSREAVRHSA
ncbi:MAG TPA: hypothetical protein VD866_21610 [Urbifossiella sp.]|nr:hypothetical protein [Urbifossiella sp.]